MTKRPSPQEIRAALAGRAIAGTASVVGPC
jgi:hypothetical protein